MSHQVTPELVEAVRVRLARTGAEPTPAQVAVALRAERAVFGDAEILAVARALCADLIGAGPLEPLLATPEVTDVLVNGPREVWVDDGHGLRPTSITFTDDAAVRRLAQRLAAAAGRRLDDASPYVDARLAGGVRLHAILPPVAPGGTCISLRLPPRRTFTLPDLVAAGTITPAAVPILTSLVATRRAFLISGGTGTGKTTLLSALLSLADAGERLLLVEDSAELRPLHPHVVRLESRPANVEGAGGVGLRDLVRQALRMRPDRLVVGEVRGAEVVDLLAALNTGHEGGCGTLHANTAADVPPRLEALGCAAGLSRQAVHSQLAAALDVVIHLTRSRTDGKRRISEICLLARTDDDLVRAIPAVTFTPDGHAHPGPAYSALTDDPQRKAGANAAPTTNPQGSPDVHTALPKNPRSRPDSHSSSPGGSEAQPRTHSTLTGDGAGAPITDTQVGTDTHSSATQDPAGPRGAHSNLIGKMPDRSDAHPPIAPGGHRSSLDGDFQDPPETRMTSTGDTLGDSHTHDASPLSPRGRHEHSALVGDPRERLGTRSGLTGAAPGRHSAPPTAPRDHIDAYSPLPGDPPGYLRAHRPSTDGSPRLFSAQLMDRLVVASPLTSNLPGDVGARSALTDGSQGPFSAQPMDRPIAASPLTSDPPGNPRARSALTADALRPPGTHSALSSHLDAPPRRATGRTNESAP